MRPQLASCDKVAKRGRGFIFTEGNSCWQQALLWKIHQIPVKKVIEIHEIITSIQIHQISVKIIENHEIITSIQWILDTSYISEKKTG